MSGFAARTEPASGIHDPLTVRALAVGDTALVTVDVVGLHEDLCARVRQECAPVARHVVVHATHTHGSAASMLDRLGGDADPEWVESVARACVETIERAVATQEVVVVRAGYGADPDVARNRRHRDGPLDRSVPVVTFDRADGSALAVLTSYACHPVVLGPDNTLLTGDYPAVVRDRLESELGGTALFATGCAGDANTGHFASTSFTADPSAIRTFEECDRVGKRVAGAALEAHPQPGGDHVDGASARVTLDVDVRTPEQLREEAELWAARAGDADPSSALVMRIWEQWARDVPADAPATWEGSVTVLRWGPAVIVALPGEPFAGTAMRIRAGLAADGVAAVLVIGYSNGSPGYFPCRDEYDHGGYEVDDAHRYYRMPGPFARGSAERLAGTALEVAGELGLTA